MHDDSDLLLVGAGLDGLQAAARALRAGHRARLVDRSPTPGGSVRTQRSEGFVCELGPFALARAEWDALAADLRSPPPAVGLLPAARDGRVWSGTGLVPTRVEGDPTSGASGLEDLVHAFRRELQLADPQCLWLGRAITALEPTANGFGLTAGGESPTRLAARAVELHLPADEAARLCAPFDPALGDVVGRLQRTAVAHVFLGYFAGAATEAALRDYGLLVEDGGGSGAREAIFCTNAFPRRAQPGKELVRVELEGPRAAGADEDAVAAARELLAAATGLAIDPVFVRVHRRTELVHDGALTECRVRLHAIEGLLPGLAVRL